MDRGDTFTKEIGRMVHELLGRLYAAKLTFADNPLSTTQLGELVDLVHSGAITGIDLALLLAKDVVNNS